MKTIYKLLAAALALGSMASCANQDDIREFIVDKPDTLIEPETLNAYGNIKDGIDRAKYPNFKLGCALGAADYSARGVVFRVANANFDEITLGNAMKYASCVQDDGTYDFGVVSQLLDDVETVEGMSVYGHTLAWHAQQNTTWLNSLLADVDVTIGPEDLIVDASVDFTTMSAFPYTLIDDFKPVIADGCLKASVSNRKHRFYLIENLPTVVGETYEIDILIKGSKSVSLPLAFGDVKGINSTIGTEWAHIKWKAVAESENSPLIVNPGPLKLDIDIASVTVGHYPPNHRPLTDQEKVDNLTAEMQRWCNGMMEACAGRVKSWDLINEAISGGGSVNGYYDLQHDNGSGDFFWQDYFGNDAYGVVVEKAARKAWADNGGNPADLKLFVNDYNLESDWDNNKKVKSLVYWVGVWEKGGAKIDGLSSQMHISYYEDENTMKSKADHYVNMLKIMAATGKLVRISELDMGYVDINGNDIATEDLTIEQHQNMANYYRYIIQMFLKLVPVEQQYGICQWCLTDAPSGSGWRANTPVGLWTQEWARKRAYAAYCDAFTEPCPDTEDFFDYLKQLGLTHYVTVEE